MNEDAIKLIAGYLVDASLVCIFQILELW
jgi:hypothetical protein